MKCQRRSLTRKEGSFSVASSFISIQNMHLPVTMNLTWIVSFLFVGCVVVNDDLLGRLATFDKCFKQCPSNPDLVDLVMTEDAVVCFEEDHCVPARQVHDDWMEGVKVFDCIQEVSGVGKQMLSGRCCDYMEHHNGCRTRFCVDWSCVFNDEGKITKHTAIMSDEQCAKAFQCAPEKMEVGAKGDSKNAEKETATASGRRS